MVTIRDEFVLEGSTLNPAKTVPIAESFTTLLNTVEQHIPNSRERSLVVTKLQEACYFAMVGISKTA